LAIAARSKCSRSRATCSCVAHAFATASSSTRCCPGLRGGTHATTPAPGGVLLRRDGLPAASLVRDLPLVPIATSDCSISAKCSGTCLTSFGLSRDNPEMSMILSWRSGVKTGRAPACMAGTLAVVLEGRSARALSPVSLERDRLILPLIPFLSGSSTCGYREGPPSVLAPRVEDLQLVAEITVLPVC
jgi:hypothetical protein